MLQYRLFPFRYFYPLVPLLFLGFIYFDSLKHILFFDTSAVDLSGGIEVKKSLLLSMLRLDSVIFDFSFYQSFIYPLVMILVAYAYYYLKSRHLKYFIGRKSDYDKRCTFLKLQLCLYVLLSFYIVIFALALVSWLNGVAHMHGNLMPYFDQSSVLRFFGQGTTTFVVYYCLVKSLALFIHTYFVCFLVDYLQSFIKSSMLYLILMWALSPLLYSYLPPKYVLMTSLMSTSYSDADIPYLLSPYLGLVGVCIILKLRKRHEII
ncbi:hypothetical protein KP781_08740 [Streptococcus equi subsp. zooepidemicus]|uniref:hypothetical protein n=1 Tax=Streptococcus equi TaxID=1336 RepID=UPI0013F5DCE0|nr:hypothetical protein [Streptococcus equi]MCD3399766.1 hypothetical protein [Streptococcus equi subsp. zooepidemicus]MCD3452074.1 hypothetical protein [Streptococcus equi subsp. zooepidemicus]HEL1087470.1 hypothetical protein [Streptococcus equi subsp. zooepidemicus]HEL1260465.1 hypothetical protein [Streptococcus equi subsp. zooepidemicus]